jgi:hypothetical protein
LESLLHHTLLRLDKKRLPLYQLCFQEELGRRFADDARRLAYMDLPGLREFMLKSVENSYGSHNTFCKHLRVAF